MSNKQISKKQKLVLDYAKTTDIYEFLGDLAGSYCFTPEHISEAMDELSKKETAQVLKLYVEWFLEKEVAE